MNPWEMDWDGDYKDKKPWEMDYSSAGKPAMEHQTYQRIHPVQQEGGALDFLRGLKEGVFDIGRGVQQRAAEVKSLGGNNVESKNKLYEEEAARRENREFNPDVTQAEKFARGLSMFGTTMPLAFLPGGQTAVSSTLMSLLSGGLAGAAFPTTSGTETLANIGAGAGGQAVGNLGSRLLLPTTARNMSQAQKDILDAARTEKIPLRTSEATGSNVIKNWEQMRANRPITGGMEERFNKAQTEAINKAFTRVLGKELPEVNDKSLKGFQTEIGGKISEMVKGKRIPLRDDFFDAVANVETEAQVGGRLTYSPQLRDRVEAALTFIAEKEKATGGEAKIAGETAQRIRSRLMNQARDARAAENTELANGLEELVDGLKKAMTGTMSEAEKAAWTEANRRYSNYKLIEEAFIKDPKSLAMGDIPINKMARVMEQNRPRSYVHGTGDLSNLAKLGQVIKPPGRSALLGETSMPIVRNAMDVAHGAVYPMLESQLMQRYLTGGFPIQRSLRDISGAAEINDALMRAAGMSLMLDKENLR
jgi:hypothetical protein